MRSRFPRFGPDGYRWPSRRRQGKGELDRHRDDTLSH